VQVSSLGFELLNAEDRILYRRVFEVRTLFCDGFAGGSRKWDAITNDVNTLKSVMSRMLKKNPFKGIS